MKLLVSIVDLEEAYEAVKGGCDILDVKNPREGSLGASHPSIIKRVVKVFKDRVEVSATIGDLPNLPGTASLAALGAASLGVDYVKAGLYGVRDPEEALRLMRWIVEAVRGRFPRVKVVACCYADYEHIGSINPIYLPEIAWRSGADGILIDVKTKGSGKVFDYMSLDELETVFSKTRSLRLTTALAGGLDIGDLDRVFRLNVDVIGIRRGVCNRKGWLNGRVRWDKVEALKRAIISFSP